MGYAFISYSSQNQSMADSMKMLLNENDIASWMAPNDIPVGKKYAQVINTAIKECDCVILLLSDAAQNSPWVPKEIERAVNHKKTIIPVKLEDVDLNDEFELYISSDQIVAIRHLDESLPETKKILRSVAAACGHTESNETVATSDEEIAIPDSLQPEKKRFSIKKRAVRIIAAILTAVFLGIFFYTISPPENTVKKIPFVNYSNGKDHIYPFRYFSGFSFEKNTFFMKNVNDGTLTTIDTGTGKTIRGSGTVKIDNTDLESVWVCSSENSDIVYFVNNNTVTIYDNMEQKWRNEAGVDLPLETTEIIRMSFAGFKNIKSSIIDEDDMFFLVCDQAKNDGCYTKSIRLTPDGEFYETDISHLNISEAVCGFDKKVSETKVPIFAWQIGGTPVLFDLPTGQIIDEEFENIYKKYMPYAIADNQTISPDGKYIIKRKSYKQQGDQPFYTEIIVWNMENGDGVFSDKIVGNHTVAFDKDNRLLIYRDGTLRVMDFTTNEPAELLDAEYFLSSPLFGSIPYAMYYSDKLDLCVWDSLVQKETTVNVITITDLNGHILYQCDDFFAPFDHFYTDTYVGDDFILHLFVSYGDNEINTIPLKTSYSKDKNGVISLK